MAKKCTLSNCEYPVFGTDKNTGDGYCKYHQWYRTDLGKKKSKKSTAHRNRQLSRNKHGFNPFKWGFNTELSMMLHIWKTRKLKSEVSGKSLYATTYSFCYFAHILCKNHYPLFRYNPDNIMLLTEREHYLVDKGTEEQRAQYEKENPGADFSIFFNKQKELLKQYDSIIKN